MIGVIIYNSRSQLYCYYILIENMNLATLSDEQLKGFIIKIFNEYDRNGNGILEAPEIALFFTDLYKSLGYNVTISLPEALQMIRQVSQNGSSALTPYELYNAFKIMSNNVNAYFKQFTPISPLESAPKQEGGMDIEHCKEWEWPDK